MDTIPTVAVTVAELRSVPTLADLPEEALTWLLTHGTVHEVAAGEVYFKVGDPVDHLMFVLAGRAEIRTPVNGVLQPFSTLLPGAITGVLPYSRMRTAGGQGLALTDLRLFQLHRDLFRELEQVSPELLQRLVEVMTDRVREQARNQQQQEKLMALGRLSAGLAHELNNPAAAIRRAAQSLEGQLAQVDTEMLELQRCQMDPDLLLRAFEQVRAYQAAHQHQKLTLLQRTAREEAIADLLLDALPDTADALAPTLADAGLDAELLAQLQTQLPATGFADFIEWLAATCEAQRLTRDIVEAAARITELVSAVKSYSHMDQGADYAPVDLHRGLQSTLTLLGHKFKDRKVQVVRAFNETLPSIRGLEGELNQVWTNLIVNALDALPTDGTGLLTLRTYSNTPGFVLVDIEDNGTGIAPEIQHRIFEPFFTTKGVGQGTGLGLDIALRIVKKHSGTVTLRSQPGQTVFTVCLPIA